MNFFGNIAGSVREINRKYARPEIETTWFVKICLLSLRIYLLTMVGLMVYALIKQSVADTSPASSTSQLPAATQPATGTNTTPAMTPPGQAP